MNYNVNYDIYKLDGGKTVARKYACFSSFYSFFKGRYKKVDIYVFKKYTEKNVRLPADFEAFTPEEVAEYARLLKSMGLNFEYREEKDQYVFSIDFDKNSIVGSKVIVNAVRHLHESEGPMIVKHFLRFSKEKVIGMTNFAKLQLACHYTDLYNYGHTFVPGYAMQKLLSKAEVEKYILKNEQNISVNELIPKCAKPIKNTPDWNSFKKLFADKEPLKVIVKKYKELCVKYT